MLGPQVTCMLFWQLLHTIQTTLASSVRLNFIKIKIFRLRHLHKISSEELLINFRELIGEHTGENMAEAVWETLTMYGIQDRVSCF